MIYEIYGQKPTVDSSCYIASSAVIIGAVTLKSGVSIWESAVLRGDIAEIFIDENSNVQDNATIHVDKNTPVRIGKNVTIGHNAVVHGCTVGDNAMIGMGAIVLNGAVVPSHCIVGAGAVVTHSTQMQEGDVVAGNPAKVIKKADDRLQQYIVNNAKAYCLNAIEFKQSLKKIED